MTVPTASIGRAPRAARVGPKPAGLLLAGAILVAAGALTVVALRGSAPPRTLQERTDAVARTLRCPVCQELSVADSPSDLARQMRDAIARQLRDGRSADQIRAGFVHAYGQWILLSPPKHGLTLLAWLIPALLVAGGSLFLVLAVRRWTLGAAPAQGSPGGPGEELTAADRRLLRRALSADPSEPG
jgi:cytochrome c-type biogenesis protein CcmH